MAERVDVFVAYAHVDAAWAAWLAGCLEASGLTTFVADWDLLPGDRRTARLDAGIAAASAAVLVCGAAAFTDLELAAQYGALRAREGFPSNHGDHELMTFGFIDLAFIDLAPAPRAYPGQAPACPWLCPQGPQRLRGPGRSQAVA